MQFGKLFSITALCVAAALSGCGSESESPPASSPSQTSRPTPGWNTLNEENFEGQATLFAGGAPAWVPDSFQFTDRFADGGSYFQAMGVTPPTAFRAEGPLEKMDG
jgi:hypothetical protein